MKFSFLTNFWIRESNGQVLSSKFHNFLIFTILDLDKCNLKNSGIIKFKFFQKFIKASLIYLFYETKFFNQFMDSGVYWAGPEFLEP